MGEQTYGIVRLDDGYSWDQFTPTGSPIKVHIPYKDRKVLDSVRIAWRHTYEDQRDQIIKFEGKPPSDGDIEIQFEGGGRKLFLEQWWSGHLPDGHGKVTW